MINDTNNNFLKNWDLRGKRAFVAGASKGIGRATSIYLAQMGAQVLCVARSKNSLLSLLSELPGKGHSILEADLSSTAGHDLVCNKMHDWGWPHIVVANLYARQTVLANTRLRNTNASQLDQIAENTGYLFAIASETIALQRKSDYGRWIGVGSMSALLGGPGQALYGMSKNSLDSFLRTLAVEEGALNITANMVSPGFIDTPGVQKNYAKELRSRLSLMNLKKRAGTAEEVAHAIAFFASPMASYITGVNMPVCAGFNLAWNMQAMLKECDKDR